MRGGFGQRISDRAEATFGPEAKPRFELPPSADHGPCCSKAERKMWLSARVSTSYSCIIILFSRNRQGDIDVMMKQV